jgi:hypothetical protein
MNVSNARLAGFQEDLKMDDTIWNTGISSFYVGYTIAQLPGNLLLAKMSPRVFMPTVMLMWSIGTICMPALTRYVLRTFVEADNSWSPAVLVFA